ncbi:hypothetical protein D9C73_028474 [Collichthys lucidus]|uniref:Uncharacterized protein n=1 Tax=Collichthys lucidus TaxID=240159 RepID=A0A4U5TW43_COLLU|nr:hypothetical protein D9C73_028474 [Collichthys lucidus]
MSDVVPRELQRRPEGTWALLTSPFAGLAGVDCVGDVFFPFPKLPARKSSTGCLLIHCGGNDLGETTSVELVNRMKEDLHQLHHWHPHMMIMFSSLCQRCQWRAGANPVRVDKARKFVNSVMATFVCGLDGAIVEHPLIKHNTPALPLIRHHPNDKAAVAFYDLFDIY